MLISFLASCYCKIITSEDQQSDYRHTLRCNLKQRETVISSYGRACVNAVTSIKSPKLYYFVPGILSTDYLELLYMIKHIVNALSKRSFPPFLVVPKIENAWSVDVVLFPLHQCIGDRLVGAFSPCHFKIFQPIIISIYDLHLVTQAAKNL